ncbi:MAG: efflux RND transporter permease subunit [Rubrivivax sp.]|nr:efflux RND transporter permease subunit [Rubrivivax sp.]
MSDSPTPPAGSAALPTSADAQPRLGVAGRLAQAFQDSALTPLLALVALLMGLFAVLVTPREEEPQINVTMANVLVPFPGASSQDVQNLVARPAEQVLSQIAGIEHTFSVSRPGLALLTVQFQVGVPRTEALVRLYDVLNANQDWLPANLGALPPIVKPTGIDDVPILAVTLFSREPGLAQGSALDLQRIAVSLESELKRVPGTREVKTLGGPGRAVQVELDPARLRARGVDLMRLQQTLAAAHLAMPGGTVADERGPRMLSVETGEFLRSVDDVADLVVGVHAGKPVYLREVATVRDGAAQPARYVWYAPGAGAQASPPPGLGTLPSAAGQNPAEGPYPAVTLSVTKKPGQNAVDVARALRLRLDELRNTVLPPGVEAVITRDYGETAGEKAAKLIQKLAFATASVILLVGLALGRREAVIVGAAVILTLTATLFASWAWGFTLNRVSLFALIFSIGILVDDAIVVVENIHRHQQLSPHRPLRELIPLAVDEVGGPTILATLTVIAALLPMAFVSGLMGPYMSPIPINSSLGMALSLLIAFTVTPWLALKLMRGPSGHGAAAASGPGGLARRLPGLFTRLLQPFLRSASRRWLLLAAIVAALVLSAGLAVVQWVVLKMLPFDNKSEFALVVDMPAGTPLEDTAAALHEMGAYLARQPEVRDIQAYAGTAAPITFNGLVRQYNLRADAEQGELQVNLVDKAHRHEQSHAIAQRLQPALRAIAQRHGARLKVVEVPPGPPVLSPIVAEVYGPDEAGRQALAARLTQQWDGAPDIVGVDNSLKADAPRAFLRVNRARAEALGIPMSTIALTVQGALSGVDAAWLHDGRSKYAAPVRLQLPRERQLGLDAVLALPLRSSDGRLVPLSELVRVERGVIDKPLFTKNLLGVTYVMADVAAGGATPDSPLYGLFGLRGSLQQAAAPGTGALGEYWIRQPSDPYRAYAVKWDGEWQITYETFRDMGAAYGVGLILIYLLVVAQFKSYLTPLVIMAPIPLTLIGVMPGHALLGAPFTATSMIGMIALAGIIVRNSILLVDFIDLQLSQGINFSQAVMQSAAVRAQPIALTGLAAMIGAFFILDDPIFNGLAISLIFGILVSTLLTLVVIPVLYYAVNRSRWETGAA